MNKIILIGNLTKDVELAQTNNGTSVAKFTLAVQRKFKNDSGEYDTDFINVVAWKQLGETAHKFLSKGKKCAVVGELQTRTYEASDKTKRYVTEVIANEIEFLSPIEKSEKVETTKKFEPIDEDDLPF